MTDTTFIEKVEKTLETCMSFDGEKHILFENDMDYMFDWNDLSTVKDTSKKIVSLLNENLDTNEYKRLFDLEVSELIKLV